MPDILDLYPDRISPEPNSGCWLWMGATKGDGCMYGRVHRAGRDVYAHHISYECAHGPVPDGLHILHKCDVKSCVNPAHLEAGTRSKNVVDALVRGRIPAGEKHGQSKATRSQVDAIRTFCQQRQPYGFWAGLARRMGLPRTLVYNIRNKPRSWAY